MIAPSSLPAFTPSVQSATRVAATPSARSDAAGSSQKPLQLPPAQLAAPGRGTPRGSLLDLSV